MLWVEQDPKLDFATFESRSLAQLESLAGSAESSSATGPTPETTTSLLAPTSAPKDAPNYEVLISGGPRNYWYYLATTSQPRRARRDDHRREAPAGLKRSYRREADADEEVSHRRTRTARAGRPPFALGGEEAPSGPAELGQCLARRLRGSPSR